jgi:hypothetical protein
LVKKRPKKKGNKTGRGTHQNASNPHQNMCEKKELGKEKKKREKQPPANTIAMKAL